MTDLNQSSIRIPSSKQTVDSSTHRWPTVFFFPPNMVLEQWSTLYLFKCGALWGKVSFHYVPIDAMSISVLRHDVPFVTWHCKCSKWHHLCPTLATRVRSVGLSPRGVRFSPGRGTWERWPPERACSTAARSGHWPGTWAGRQSRSDGWPTAACRGRSRRRPHSGRDHKKLFSLWFW